LYWYRQPNKNNHSTENTNSIKLTQPKKSPYLTAQHIHQKKPRLRDRTEREPGLVAFYDIQPGNGVGRFLQTRSPHASLKQSTHKKST